MTFYDCFTIMALASSMHLNEATGNHKDDAINAMYNLLIKAATSYCFVALLRGEGSYFFYGLFYCYIGATVLQLFAGMLLPPSEQQYEPRISRLPVSLLLLAFIGIAAYSGGQF